MQAEDPWSDPDRNTFPKDEFSSSNNVVALLPSDFDMTLLSSRPYKTNPINWNHGDAAGVASALGKS